MTGPAYYNEIDPFAAEWLRRLIARGLIAPGDVDQRSIVDVRPSDLRGYAQCHFFAGIGGWSHALRLAGWPDDRPVWTGSCPCQPFSTAGQQRGSNDERHLWPSFFGLIPECRPAAVFGEQVAGAAGLAWLDHVCADLEGAGYAAAAADLCAAGVGAPHIRQRLYWVAYDDAAGRRGQRASRLHGDRAPRHDVAGCGADGGMADPERRAAERHGLELAAQAGAAASSWPQRQRLRTEPVDGRFADGLGDTPVARLQGGAQPGQRADAQREAAERAGAAGSGMGDPAGEGLAQQRGRRDEPARLAAADPLAAWHDVEWLTCSDGKARPTEPGLQPLAHGVPGRVGRLRAYGNAIVPQIAAAFVMACMEGDA